LEAFGIAIALIGGLFAAPIFCIALVIAVRRVPPLASAGFWTAAPLFALFTVEIVLVTFLGIQSTRTVIGPLFYLLHVLLTFAAAPALAGLLLLGRRHVRGGWPVAAALTWLVGAGAVFLQYEVTEALYGIDGRGGTYRWPW